MYWKAILETEMEDVSRQNSGSTNHKQLFHSRAFDWSCELPFCLQFLAGATWARSLQQGAPHKSLASAACHLTLILLAWLGVLFQTANSPGISAPEMSLCWFIWKLKTIPEAIWNCRQYQTHREIKEIGKVCLLIYKVMVYLKIRIEFEVLDSPKHMSCWVEILSQFWAPEMMLQERGTRLQLEAKCDQRSLLSDG